jgi:hypothetical protein
MSRKNLSDVNPQDLLLKWQYESQDGHDVYNVFAVADYLVTSRPLGRLTISSRSGTAVFEVSRDLKGVRLQALGGSADAE